MQGDLWRIASRGALGGALLVLPFLFVVAREQGFSTLGPFADAWWVTAVLAVLGLGFALDSVATCARASRRVAHALARSYDLKTIGFVLADLHRDMGFLLQGSRYFSETEMLERRTIAGLRLFAALAYAAAGLWLPIAMSVGLLLAARGMLSPSALWMIVLLPPGVLYLFGAVAGATEDRRVRRARRAWYRQPWARDLEVGEIETWRAQLSEHVPLGALTRGDPGRAPIFRRIGVLFGMLSVVVAIPVLTLVPTSAIGPVLAQVAIPRFDATVRRWAESEAFRDLRVAPVGEITAQEAGRLLQELIYVGSNRPPSEGERIPAVRHASPWIPASSDGNPLGVEPHRWAEVVFGMVVDGLSEEQAAYIAEIAAHPARDAFSRLGRAAQIDPVSGRWESPLPPDMTLAALPIPRFSSLRSGGYSQMAAAAHELRQGNPGRAEEMIREVVSVGFLMGDHGPTLIENLIGFAMVKTGTTGLLSFYSATGRTAEAEELRRLRDAVGRVAGRLRVPSPGGPADFVQTLPAVTLDANLPRGLGWEYLALSATLTPCINLHRMVFGQGDDFAEFVERAHDALVRWPSEEELFRLTSGGYLGRADAEVSWIGRVLGVAMSSSPGSCGAVVRRLETLQEVARLR